MRALFKFLDGAVISAENFNTMDRDLEGPQDLLDSIKHRRDRNDNFSFEDSVNGIDVVKKGKDLVAVEFIF